MIMKCVQNGILLKINYFFFNVRETTWKKYKIFFLIEKKYYKWQYCFYFMMERNLCLMPSFLVYFGIGCFNLKA